MVSPYFLPSTCLPRADVVESSLVRHGGLMAKNKNKKLALRLVQGKTASQ
jgi:hypothetical protein